MAGGRRSQVCAVPADIGIGATRLPVFAHGNGKFRLAERLLLQVALSKS